jgi:hypothetical protein
MRHILQPVPGGVLGVCGIGVFGDQQQQQQQPLNFIHCLGQKVAIDDMYEARLAKP